MRAADGIDSASVQRAIRRYVMVAFLTVLSLHYEPSLIEACGRCGKPRSARFSKERWTLVYASTATAASMRSDHLRPFPPVITRRTRPCARFRQCSSLTLRPAGLERVHAARMTHLRNPSIAPRMHAVPAGTQSPVLARGLLQRQREAERHALHELRPGVVMRQALRTNRDFAPPSRINSITDTVAGEPRGKREQGSAICGVAI